MISHAWTDANWVITARPRTYHSSIELNSFIISNLVSLTAYVLITQAFTSSLHTCSITQYDALPTTLFLAGPKNSLPPCTVYKHQ